MPVNLKSAGHPAAKAARAEYALCTFRPLTMTTLLSRTLADTRGYSQDRVSTSSSAKPEHSEGKARTEGPLVRSRRAPRRSAEANHSPLQDLHPSPSTDRQARRGRGP